MFFSLNLNILENVYIILIKMVILDYYSIEQKLPKIKLMFDRVSVRVKFMCSKT